MFFNYLQFIYNCNKQRQNKTTTITLYIGIPRNNWLDIKLTFL